MDRWEQLRPAAWRLREPVDHDQALALMASRLLVGMTSHRPQRGRCTACEEFWPCYTERRRRQS